VFTIKRPSSEMESRKLTVFFQGDTLARFEGDEMSVPHDEPPRMGAENDSLCKAPRPIPVP